MEKDDQDGHQAARGGMEWRKKTKEAALGRMEWIKMTNTVTRRRLVGWSG